MNFIYFYAITFSYVFQAFSMLFVYSWGNSTDMANIYSGIESGPLVLFDDKFGMAQVITTFEEFLGGGVQYNLEKKQAAWGILGSVKDVPKGYRFSTISVAASGIRTVKYLNVGNEI